jgi:hypothetical protein
MALLLAFGIAVASAFAGRRVGRSLRPDPPAETLSTNAEQG